MIPNTCKPVLSPRLWTIALVCLGLLASEQGIHSLTGDGQAYAQGRKQRVALFVLPSRAATPEVSKVLQTLVRQQLATLGGVRGLTGSPDPVTGVEATLEANIESAYRELNSREYAKAKALFKTAYDGLIRYEGPTNQRLMARAVKGLSVAMAASGAKAKAKEMMRACMNLWPHQDVSDYAYTLDVQNLFKEAVTEADASGKGKIDVVSDPPNAIVRLNGVVKGYTPYTIEDAPAGPNWVSIQLDGHIRQGAFVDVAPNKLVGHGFALNPVRNATAYRILMKNVRKSFKSMRKVGAALENLRTFLRADGIVFLELSTRRGYALNGWHVGGDGSAIPMRGSFNPGATLLQDIQVWLAQSLNKQAEETLDPLPLDAPPQASVVIADADMLFIDPDDPILSTRKAAVKDPITGKWWFWTILGAATAGVAGMVVALLGEQGQAKGPVGNLSLQLHAQ